MNLRRRVLAWVARKPGRGTALLVAPGTLWLACFFLVPLLVLLGYSVMERGPHGGVAPGFTLAHYRRFLDPLYLGILGRTAWLAFLTTVVCLVLAYPTAWAITRSGRWRNLLLFLAVLPFWTSTLVRTYAMMFLLRDSGILNRLAMDLGLVTTPVRMLYTGGAVLAGLVYSGLPFMILPIYASLEKLDRSLLEAAEGLGARPLARFTRVVLPLSLPGVLAGSLLVFIPSLGSFVVPDLLGGARQVLAGNLIQAQFGPARNWPFGSAAGFIVMAAVMVVLMGWVMWGRRVEKAEQSP